MTGNRRWAILVIGVWLAVIVPAPAADFADINAKDVNLKVEQVGTSPYPYQAVRLRLILRNVSDKKLGPIRAIDDAIDVQVKGPGDKAFRRLRGAILVHDAEVAKEDKVRALLNERVPLTLEPGEQTSVSFAVVAEWQDEKEVRLADGKPVFPHFGSYSLKCMYPVDRAGKSFIEASIQIEVATPEGVSKEVQKLLDKDAALRTALMSPVDAPAKELAPKLKSIREDYRLSVYEPYLRYALARCHLGGSGYRPVKERLERAKAGDLLEGLYSNYPNAYHPNVCLALMAADASLRKSLTEVVEFKYPDALEWLEKAARTMKPEEWKKFRKSSSEK